MRWNEIRISTAHAGVDLLGDALTEAGFAGFTVEDGEDFAEFAETIKPAWQDVDEEFAASLRGVCRVTLYLPDNEDGRAALESLPGLFEALRADWPAVDFGPLELAAEPKDDEDWMNSWKQFYKPFPVGEKILIKPEWETVADTGGRIVFNIDPGMAFGSGDHASTKLCIGALEKAVRGGEAVLDVGSGSGILSVISVLLGVKSALGLDIDGYAAKVAEKNAELNGAQDKCRFVQGDVLSDGFILEETYDIVVANIVADVIIALAPRARKLLKPGGTFIVSGIIDARENDVKSALAAAGFAVGDVYADAGWVCIVSK